MCSQSYKRIEQSKEIQRLVTTSEEERVNLEVEKGEHHNLDVFIIDRSGW